MTRDDLIISAGERAREYYDDTGACFFCAADRDKSIPHDPDCEVGQIVALDNGGLPPYDAATATGMYDRD